MQVVEHQHQRLLPRGVDEERGQRVEQADARAVGVERRRRRRGRQELGDLREHLRHVRRAAPELGAHRVAAGLAYVAAQGLEPGPVCRGAAGFPRAAPEHARPARIALLGHLCEQPALADAGLAAHEHEPPVSRDGVSDPAGSAPKLLVAADEVAAAVGRRAGRRRSGELERGVLAQDGALELAQLGARCEADLHERQARLPVGLERLGLAAGAVERGHELGARVLPQGLACHERLHVADHRGVLPEGQPRVDPPLERVEAEVLEPGRLGLREGVVAEVGERRAAPQLERGGERGHRRGRVACVRRLVDHALEARAVELAGTDPQDVPARARGQRLARRLEHLSQLRHVHLKRLLRARGGVLSPQLVDQAVARHDLVRVQQEDGQQRALLGAPKADGAVPQAHLERP